LKYHWVIIAIFLLGCTQPKSTDGQNSVVDEWKNPNSWSEVTNIEGRTVKLKMVRRTQVGISEIKSAQELKANDGCAAHYYYVKDGKTVLHGPSYSWKPDGRIEQKSYNIDGKLQYLYRYYKSGEVINSIILNNEANQITTNWYEKNGKLIGQYIANNKPAGQMTEEDNMYFWDGKKVSRDEYAKRIEAFILRSVQ
jgi:antitoxin component YwqK of YwqJK toxin-antitoxin module